ncbi:MAG TPA: hypothetical protein PLP17_00615 [Oligoflexia bacterium]|nr:hypothetical protein [Oligoflexia bacterium]
MKMFMTLVLILLFPTAQAAAECSDTHKSAAPEKTAESALPAMIEDSDGDVKKNQFVRIDPQGSITRALCPYTCEMRGLPKEHCRMWRSQIDPQQCYVQDTRIASNAIRFGADKTAP